MKKKSTASQTVEKVKAIKEGANTLGGEAEGLQEAAEEGKVGETDNSAEAEPEPKKAEPKEEPKKEEPVKAEPVTETPKVTAVAYVGPAIPFVIRRGAVFLDGLPAKVNEKIKELPALSRLFVPITEVPEANKQLADKTSAISNIYKLVADTIKS